MPFLGINMDDKGFDEFKFKKDQLIYCQGSSSLGAYFVKKGSVKIRKTGSGGKEQIIRISIQGDLLNFTELAVNMKFNSTSQALEDTTIGFIEKQVFRKLINTQNKISEQFILLLSKELSDAETRIADMAYKPVKARLADALINLFNRYNQKNENLTDSFFISRKDLACYTGTAKETVNRLLSDFRNEKLISTTKSKINIIDFKGLIALSDLHN